MSKMTLNEEVAVEVMGWQKLPSGSWLEYNVKVHLDWKPDEDLNHARMAFKKGHEVIIELGNDPMEAMQYLEDACEDIFEGGTSKAYLVAFITPEQICQAVLMAVREARK